MRIVLYIFLFTMIGCKTKSVTVEKSIEKEEIEYLKKFDSIIHATYKLQQEFIQKQSSFSNNLIIKSFPVLDSLGNIKPLHYKHYIDGKLAEEIYLEGGELSSTTEIIESEGSEIRNEVSANNLHIKADVGIKAQSEKATIDKRKTAEVKGFQFGFYLWLFLILIVLIILWWISNKFKLPDKFSSLFDPKGG